MEIKAAELNEKLTYLAFGVSKTISQLAYADCVMFNEGTAYCFSGSTQSSVSLDLGLTGAVNYSDLSNQIRMLTYADPDMVLDIFSEGNTLVMKRGRSITRFPFADHVPVTLETLGVPDPDGWEMVPQGVKLAIKKCEAIFTRQVVSDNILSCIHITGECFEAATPEQVIRVKCPMTVPFPFLVKFGCLGRLFGAKYPDPAEYQINGKWLFFRNLDTVFGIPISRDSFVSIDRFFDGAGEEITLPDEESLDIQFFNSFYVPGCSGIRMEFRGDTCSLSLKTKRGQHSVEFPLVCPKNETYYVTPGLLRVLAKYGKCSFTGNCVHVKTPTVDYTASVQREGEYAV